MKKSILWFLLPAFIVVAGSIFYGCTEKEEWEEEEEVLKGTIYGTVTDFVTGEPIGNANVKLRPSGETTLTGNDGTFQFNNLEDGKYSLSLSKNGYVDLDDDYVINLKSGDKIRRDIQLRAQISSFAVTINGNDVDTIDFGSDPLYRDVSFTVLNNGTTKLEMTLKVSTNWLCFLQNTYEVNNEYATLYPNEGANKILRIERQKLQVGENIGYMYVSAGTLTKTYVIKATGLGMPVVSNPILTNKTSNTCNAQSTVIENGGWNIQDKGFEYQATNGGWNKISCGPGESNFNAQIPLGIGGTYSYGNKVRAYATNGVYTAYSGWVYLSDNK